MRVSRSAKMSSFVFRSSAPPAALSRMIASRMSPYPAKAPGRVFCEQREALRHTSEGGLETRNSFLGRTLGQLTVIHLKCLAALKKLRRLTSPDGWSGVDVSSRLG